jgi:hypothetical protein
VESIIVRDARPSMSNSEGLYELAKATAFTVQPDDQNDGSYFVSADDGDDFDNPFEAPIVVNTGVGAGDSYDLAQLIRRLLDAEHKACVDGYDGVEDRLSRASAGYPVVRAAMSYVVKPDADGLDDLRRACRGYLASL